MTLYSPVYNQSAATLAFNVSLVPGQHRGRVADFYRRAAKIPGFVTIVERLEDAFHLDNIALFIDNFQSTNLLDPNPVDNTVIPGAPLHASSGLRMRRTGRYVHMHRKQSIWACLVGHSRHALHALAPLHAVHGHLHAVCRCVVSRHLVTSLGVQQLFELFSAGGGCFNGGWNWNGGCGGGWWA